MFIGYNFIDGDFTRHRPDFQSINPSTEEELGLFPMATSAEVDEAIASAKKAFFKWREVSRVKRAEYFDTLAQLVKQNSARIIRAISEETGKTLNESLAEVNESIHMLQYTFGMGRMPYGEVIASEIAAKDSYVIRKPKGVVAVISPWNFPYAIGPCWNCAPALLEGNTVVFKPSEDTPMVGQIAAELYKEAGFPEGVFNLLHGDGSVGDRIISSEDINHICFTGSAQVGKHIRQTCARSWHKTCSCEMGSKSAVIVFDDADMDIALPACVASAYKLSGQRCVSAGRMLIHRPIYETFVKEFVKASEKIEVGDPFQSKTVQMGPLINRRQLENVEYYNEATKSRSKVLLQGERQYRTGFFLTPHVHTCEWTPNNERPDFLREEIFGPSIALIPFDDLDHAVHIYNDTPYGLSCAVCTKDYRKMREIRNRCDFGLGYVNLPCIGAESSLSFGGVKKSGNGWPSGTGTFDAVVNKITWTVNHEGGGFQLAQGLHA